MPGGDVEVLIGDDLSLVGPSVHVADLAVALLDEVRGG
jgi:hypothetical protein